MKRFEYTVTAPQGIHGRPAAELVKLAKQYQSTVTLQCGERRCDVKQLIKMYIARNVEHFWERKMNVKNHIIKLPISGRR